MRLKQPKTSGMTMVLYALMVVQKGGQLDYHQVYLFPVQRWSDAIGRRVMYLDGLGAGSVSAEQPMRPHTDLEQPCQREPPLKSM